MNPNRQAVQTGYAPVNRLRIYFEIHGVAQPGRPPLVLLHGGGDTIETSFGPILPALARERQVIAFEQQGYGRTADVRDRPFSFEQSADDTAALLEHLRIAPEHAVDLFRLLPQARLAVLPGTDHMQVTARTEWLVPMIGGFLDAESPR